MADLNAAERLVWLWPESLREMHDQVKRCLVQHGD